MPPAAPMTHGGRCLCGAVAYEVTGVPLALVLCHCTFCQRATGSSVLVEPIWRDRDFRVTAGRPRLYAAQSLGSGKRVTLHFCDACGTKLFQEMERFPGVVGVYGGTLDDAALAAEAPQTWRIFLEDAQKGVVIPPGVDLWPRHRFGADGGTAEPFRYDEFHVV